MSNKGVIGGLILAVTVLAFIDPFMDFLGLQATTDPLFTNLSNWAPWVLVPLAVFFLAMAFKEAFEGMRL